MSIINKSIESSNINDDDNKLCVICMDDNGIIVLCSKCKYLYCLICAKKINNLCSICFRPNQLNQLNQLNLLNQPNELTNYYTYGDYVYEVPHTYFFTISISVIITVIISFCWLLLFIFFGYIGIIFISKIIHYFIYLI